ncbi:hypothetical protein N7520_000727 [Penicillium odoratum]|uniref:uncharacterized protein n=1 Tax=Penicillium odoratum TaxID=1167516 RepID=UPI002548474A|nr:uncharacterized protein N7520_000727 [Penicillium odoratum]KAJ5777481.1 hypothetical protein N7520_000727 [Penicillium odoratum]
MDPLDPLMAGPGLVFQPPAVVLKPPPWGTSMMLNQPTFIMEITNNIGKIHFQYLFGHAPGLRFPEAANVLSFIRDKLSAPNAPRSSLSLTEFKTVAPWWQPPYIDIAASKEEAAMGNRFERTAYFGTEHHPNVHAAEIGGLILTLRLTDEDTQFQQDVEIYSYNQSALQVIQNPRQNSAQCLLKEVIRLID